MTSQRFTTSCFESISSTANADLKQPLVVEAKDFESSFSSSSQEEEQMCETARRRVSTLVLMESLCLGCLFGLLIQSGIFSVFLVITKNWGSDPQQEESTILPHWTLYLLLCMDVAFYGIIWAVLFTALTRQGSMYTRKKFDIDADAPSPESVWTPQFLFTIAIVFLIGHIVGSYAAWAIVYMQLGMPLQLTPLLFRLLTDVGLCHLTVKWFDLGGEHPDDDDEDSDAFFVV
jgi:hypothetical protein